MGFYVAVFKRVAKKTKKIFLKTGF